MRIRTFTAVAFTAAALVGAGCGDEEDVTTGTGSQDEAPLNDDTPAGTGQTAAPNSDDVEPDEGGG